MQVLTDLKSFRPDPNHPLVLGLGNFDGLHQGHQKLLKHVLEKARQLKGISAVLTFREHPQHVLHPKAKQPLLTPGEYKLVLLCEAGIEFCLWLPFTQEFSKIEPESFVKEILVNKLHVKEVCLGYNARFGHDRRGDASLVRKLAVQYGFEFEEIPPVQMAGDFVSSSRIRRLVAEGDLEQASACLGHPFTVLGKVVGGAGRGKGLGFPTANLEISNEVMPPEGVYPVEIRRLELSKILLEKTSIQDFRVSSKGPRLFGVLNYGCRPTFKTQGQGAAESVAEVFILDFAGELYGEFLEVVFHPRLRTEMAFENPELLKNQIQKDIEKTRAYFGSLKKAFTKARD
jgi:riboflavin kinase/FMN adenylyltransferase